jgi:hypothetical protein
MTQRTFDRRSALRRLGGVAAVYAVGVGPTAAQTSHDGDVTISVDNVGAQAWEVTGVSGGDVAPVGEQNPTLTLQTGTRYTVENGGWDTHPFALRDPDAGAYGGGESLLSQSGRGSFEDDPAVDWVDDGERLSFTLTETLADAVGEYVCTVHGTMVGTVETKAPPEPNYQNPDGSVSIDAPTEGVSVATPVTLEMSATDFVVEPASAGVEPGHGHLHVLVDQPFVTPGEKIPFEEGYNHYGGGATRATLDLDPGQHTLRLQAGDANHVAYDLTDEVTLTVEEDGPLPATAAEYDTSGDGGIDLDELARAAIDFGRGDLSLTELQSVVAAFAG